MIYSHSNIYTFEKCPYKFKLKYIDRINPVFEHTIESFQGLLVHQTLEKLYTDLEYNSSVNLNDLLSFLHKKWDELYNEEILIVKKQYSMEDYLSLAEQYITDYYNAHTPFTDTNTIALEDHVVFSLDEEQKYRVQGYIDRLSERKPGIYEIHDYKTTSRLPSQKKLETDRQLCLYALGVKQKYSNVKDIILVWHFLKFNKTIQLNPSVEQFSQIKSKVISSIERIEQITHYPQNPSPLCHWCEYKPICPKHSRLFDIKGVSNEWYLKESGQQRVDRYANFNHYSRQ